MYKIYNEDCLITMKEHIEPKSVDIVLTSPPYNIQHNSTNIDIENRVFFKLGNTKVRYSDYQDNKPIEEYINFLLSVFNDFNIILKENGVVLWNFSYGNSSIDVINSFYYSLYKIISETNFIIADKIVWKKSSCIPINSNKLSRLCEDVFVFVRKSELKTFTTNKKLIKFRGNSLFYENIPNFIEAKITMSLKF